GDGRWRAAPLQCRSDRLLVRLLVHVFDPQGLRCPILAGIIRGGHSLCCGPASPRRTGHGRGALHLPPPGPYIWRAGTWNRSMALRSLALSLLAALPMMAASADVSAQERRVPASPNEVRLSYAPVVQRAAPAVVNVYAARTVTSRNPFMDDPIFRR